jgi:hypothetical protein
MGGIADNLSNSMPMTDCVDKVLDRLAQFTNSKAFVSARKLLNSPEDEVSQTIYITYKPLGSE